MMPAQTKKTKALIQNWTDKTGKPRFIGDKNRKPSLGFPLLRMEVDREKSSDENTFEYNNYPVEEVQTIWLADWFKQKQVEFNLKTETFWKQKDFMKQLTDLFKESYEVSVTVCSIISRTTLTSNFLYFRA